jgi:hypothetical protein
VPIGPVTEDDAWGFTPWDRWQCRKEIRKYRSEGIFTPPSAQGTLHDALAVVAFHVAGPSRSAALSLNMLALIGWQLALFFAVARTSGSRPLAFASALFPLALAGPWQNVPGSAFDFRLDHLAMCALGITAAMALLADGFHSRRGSSWFGIAVGLTLVTRFLTGTYFVLIFAGFALWTLARPPERSKPHRGRPWRPCARR